LHVTRGRRVAAWLLLAAALGLAILGQIYFFQRREYGWDGLVFHVIAALCFVLAWHLTKPTKPRTTSRPPLRLGAWLRARTVPAALLTLGAFFSLLAVFLMQNRTLSQSTHDAVLFWGLGVACVGLAALWPVSRVLPPFRAWKESLRAVRRDTVLEVATVAALTLLALVLRVAALDSVPYTLGGDEAWHGLLARQVLAGQVRNPFTVGYMSMPTAFYWPLSWSLWLIGDTVTGLRFPAALVGTITVPIFYLFARDLWGRRTALLSSIFVAAYDYHIHFSRLGANNVWDPLFIVLTLWALDRGLRDSSSDPAQHGEGSQEGERPKEPSSLRYRYFLLAGLVMGFSTLFYTGARLLPVLVGIYVTFVWLQRRRQVARLGLHVVLLVLTFVTVAGPMLSYAQSHPDEWNARLNQVGIVQSGWLEREPELTGESTVHILAEQFLRAAGAFHYFPDRTAWYGAERPLLGFLAGACAVFGMAWAVAHWRDRRYFLVLIWFWSVIITGGMLTESPPSSQRLVIAIPAVALLVAFGLDHSVRLVCRLLDIGRTRENVALGVVVTILAMSSIYFYFVEFTPTRRYGSANGETATMMGHYLRELEGETQAYLFGAPNMYWKFGTMPFMAPRVQGKDVVEPLDGPPDFVDETDGTADRGIVFLFLPERSGELVWVQQAFPGGHLLEFKDRQGRLRFIAYEAP
jgi:4-amino-4-deoxy-L-arabinose transferase-like glycosyltransferase